MELPNGDLLAAWFQGSGERTADDVRIIGARLKKGSKQWTPPFPLAYLRDSGDSPTRVQVSESADGGQS